MAKGDGVVQGQAFKFEVGTRVWVMANNRPVRKFVWGRSEVMDHMRKPVKRYQLVDFPDSFNGKLRKDHHYDECDIAPTYKALSQQVFPPRNEDE